MAELVRVVPYRATYPLVAVVAAFFGVGLPLLAHFGVPADRHSGARLSYLYFANICGSAAGSLLTGFVLLDVMTLGGIAALLAVLGFFIFVGILLLGSRMSPLRVALTTFALGWLVVVLTVAAYMLLFYLLSIGAASRVASLFYLTPPTTAVMGYLVFGESFGVLALIGMAVAVAGFMMAVK